MHVRLAGKVLDGPSQTEAQGELADTSRAEMKDGRRENSKGSTGVIIVSSGVASVRQKDVRMVRKMKERRSRDVTTNVGVSVNDSHGRGITRMLARPPTMICTPLKHCRSEVSFALQLAVIGLPRYTIVSQWVSCPAVGVAHRARLQCCRGA